MAIATSGAVSFSNLRSEFVGGSGPVSFSSLYRGGSNIPAKAANNIATNLAASVPTSGAVNFTNFRGTTKGFRYTYTAGATNQNASALFGSDYAVNILKEIVINSGVELGATSTAEEALQINAGGAGTIRITNNGTLTGAGGAANSGAGGDAFEANASCILINNGTIRSGGGGAGRGGNGGTGGGGSYTTTSYSGCTNWWQMQSAAECNNYANALGHIPCTPYIVSMMEDYYWQCVAQLRSTSTVNTNGGAGGSGGNGGRGAGYNQTVANGSGGTGGANGGTNAGKGGTGGTGGSGGGFGSNGGNGNTGNTGANGNRTGGSAGAGGSAGGAAGAAIRNIGNVVFSNFGTVQGGQV